MPIGVLDIRNWFDMGKVHGKTSILEIISEAWNINTDRNDNNDSDCEAEPAIQADALKALNIFIYFFTNSKGREEYFKTVPDLFQIFLCNCIMCINYHFGEIHKTFSYIYHSFLIPLLVSQ